MGSGVPTGLRGGTIGLVGPISQPRGTIDTASLTLIHTRAIMHILNQLYSRKLRVTCFLINRGEESHQTLVYVRAQQKLT